MLFGLDNPARSKSPALFDSGAERWWTFAELCSEVENRQKQLPATKSLLFCFCRNNIDSVSWYLAALESDHAIALLDDNLGNEFKLQLLEKYQPELAYSSAAVPGDEYTETQTQGLWTRTTKPVGDLHPDLGLLLSTSGSTGSPKFVRLTRANVVANAESISEALGMDASDRAIASLPIHYSFGLSVLNTHLLTGASMVLTDEGLLSQTLWELVRKTECTSFAGVPYSYQILDRLNLDRLNVPKLLTLLQAGGKLPEKLVSKFHEIQQRRGGKLFVMYGQTEATARIAILPSQALPEKLGTAGRAIPRGKIEILTDSGELTTEPSINGELIYSGPNVMMGYATERADLANGDELNGRLSTGDTGILDEDGFITIQGRRKRDAKVFGLRINMDEVEGLLKAQGPTAVVDGNGKLIVFCDYPAEFDLVECQKDLATRLKIHHTALDFRRLAPIPVTPSGKIDYKRLMEQL